MTLAEEKQRRCETRHTHAIFLSACLWDPEGHVSTGGGGGSGLRIPGDAQRCPTKYRDYISHLFSAPSAHSSPL
jgi:hypothetical protein